LLKQYFITKFEITWLGIGVPIVADFYEIKLKDVPLYKKLKVEFNSCSLA